MNNLEIKDKTGSTTDVSKKDRTLPSRSRLRKVEACFRIVAGNDRISSKNSIYDRKFLQLCQNRSVMD